MIGPAPASPRRQRYDIGRMLVTATILVIVLGMVMISMNLIETVSNGVSAQYQEFDQVVPSLGRGQDTDRRRGGTRPADRRDPDAAVLGFGGCRADGAVLYRNDSHTLFDELRRVLVRQRRRPRTTTSWAPTPRARRHVRRAGQGRGR